LIDALAMTRRINPQVRRHRSTRVEDLVLAALIAGLAAAVLLAAALLAVPLWSALAAN
jgi:sterol desaturase/sphingolipid hydroxylase (fatty acid hydroxylase superfamily)